MMERKDKGYEKWKIIREKEKRRERLEEIRRIIIKMKYEGSEIEEIGEEDK